MRQNHEIEEDMEEKISSTMADVENWTAPHVPERMLCLNILQRALTDLMGIACTQNEQESALNWFLSKEHKYVFSFKAIRRLLDLGALEIRVIKDVIRNAKRRIAEETEEQQKEGGGRRIRTSIRVKIERLSECGTYCTEIGDNGTGRCEIGTGISDLSHGVQAAGEPKHS